MDTKDNGWVDNKQNLYEYNKPDCRSIYFNRQVSEYKNTTENKKYAESLYLQSRMSSADTEVPSMAFRKLHNNLKQPSIDHISESSYVDQVSRSYSPNKFLFQKEYKHSNGYETRIKQSNIDSHVGGTRIVPRDRLIVNKNQHTSSSTNNIKWDLPKRYKMVDIVGSGSYGQVCRAFDLEKQRYVAIKRIHRVFDDLIDCKRILREIAILNRLDHPNIVKILDICIPHNVENFDMLYVVLEIAASDIKLLVRSPAFLNENHIRLLLYNLLNGVNYLHNVGIYHRDLKPANCLVNRDCTIMICDFGLARTATLPDDMLCMSMKSAVAATDLTSTSRTIPDSDDYNEELMQIQNLSRTQEAYNRQLTSHVVTRWYRAPELILLQENYTSAIDVWSVGCIFAELLNMMKSNVPDAADRCPLFPGSCCFPLSPDNKNNGCDSSDTDQLNVIFNVIGTPSDEDLEDISKEDVRRYVRMFEKRPGINLREKYKGASSEAIDLLQKMLTFNPKNRITTRDALMHDYFRRIRNPEHFDTLTNPISVPFNDWLNMTEGQLRYAFLREIQRYHSNFKIPFKIIYRP